MEEYYLIKEKNRLQFPLLTKKEIFLRKLIEKILKFILPVTNPDFYGKIDEVGFWYVEFLGYIPTREIGFDVNNIPIIILPYKRNEHGFWNDSGMTLEDFQNKSDFYLENITKEEFDNKWNSFIFDSKI